MSKTTVEFFVSPTGKSPVREFIDRCPDRQQVKILRFLQHLQEFGLTTTIPNTKKLKGTPLWELRILGKDNIRIIYAPLDKGRVVVLHVFLKKTRKHHERKLVLPLVWKTACLKESWHKRPKPHKRLFLGLRTCLSNHQLEF